MTLKTIIIDDEPIALEKLRKYVEKISFLELAGAFGSGFDAIDFLQANKADLIITDINMPDLSGMELIRSLPNPPMVIFITAHPQYAVESYRVSATDYLLKPYDFADFSRSVTKARELSESRQQTSRGTPSAQGDSIFIKTDYRYVRISLCDILYIKGYGEYLQIYMENRDTPVLTLSSFASIKGHLSDAFLQVHRSYIVNMDRVDQIERNRLTIGNDTVIPVGDSYKGTFQDYLASHTVGKAPKQH